MQRASWPHAFWCKVTAGQLVLTLHPAAFKLQGQFPGQPFLVLMKQTDARQCISKAPEILVIGPQGHIEKR